MLENIKGIGPKMIDSLNKLNIFKLEDLISYYPYRYNYFIPSLLSSAVDNETIVLTGKVESSPKAMYIKRNLNKLSFNFNTDNQIISVIIFNRLFLKPHLIVNKTITIIGKYNKIKNNFVASDIRLRPVLKPEIEPVYHLSNQLKKNVFVNIMQNALALENNYQSAIPNYLVDKYGFINKAIALKYIHRPNNNDELKKAKVRLIYEELFEFMLKINFLKIRNSLKQNDIIKKFDQKLLEEFISSLPFKLTEDQNKALEDLINDFNSSKRMNRLILGDVGCGKTIVAAIALYINYLAGYQGVLMAPTEILSEQHYRNIFQLFEQTNVNVVLLTSSTKRKERNEIIEGLKTNKINILIGTHSVLNDEIIIPNLGLVVTDEQHRFGVKQRQNLQQKGVSVDVLYLSATPIPRTLALTIYGDMNISQIKSKPHQNDIKTKLVKNSDIKEVLSDMVDEIKKGHQIYVVAPTIEESDESELENVNELYKKLNNAFNKKIPMAVIHGKLKSKDKDQIMTDFKDNKVKILLSTTVIEVGIDVKNATMMVIFNAERFGLATLHQLRGRVGRNEFESKCIIISDYESERLKVLEESNDGFYISEKDFELRGTGDLFGIRQSGDMNFKLADLKSDLKILMKCKEDSEEFLKEHLNNLDNFPLQKQIISTVDFID